MVLFNYILSFNNLKFYVFETIDELYFKAKDILIILGYSQDKKTINSCINKIPDKYKKSLKDLKLTTLNIENLTLTNDEISQHLEKEIYINKLGLYRLISKSNKNTEEFFNYICDLIYDKKKESIYKYKKFNSKLKSDIKILIDDNEKMFKINKNLLEIINKYDIELDFINKMILNK